VAASNFLRQRIEQDRAARPEQALLTRFPPEPNGYLHIGHAKAICLNFGLANEYGGQCNLRYDDTNPEKENQEFVDGIRSSVEWLGFNVDNRVFFASDYFEFMFECAVQLIERGLAYVDSQSAEDMRARRGSLTLRGENSPFRDRSVEENLSLFKRMRAGEFAEGAHVLRAKIDMASPNMNLRDPAIYRIRFAHHHRSGNTWTPSKGLAIHFAHSNLKIIGHFMTGF
jgi:glutaminyl-tRNA synthetase